MTGPQTPAPAALRLPSTPQPGRVQPPAGARAEHSAAPAGIHPGLRTARWHAADDACHLAQGTQAGSSTGRRDVSNSLGWMSPADWLATREAEAKQVPAPGEIIAHPTLYNGTQFRSELEAGWARTLDHLGIEWEYEQRACKLPSGTFYLPDLWLPAIRTFIEVKGPHGQRRHKPQELAEEVDEDVIVLIGWPPVTKCVSATFWDPFLNWLDPLGYDTRLALCPACAGWQWMRAQLSRDCRLCGTPHTGLLARSGEIPFHRAQADLPFWMDGR